MLDLDAPHLSLVRAILAEQLPGAKAWAFGSRVQGRASKFSDLDLAIDAGQPLDFRRVGEVKSAFQDSRLPIHVDVVDVRSASPEF